MMSDRPDDGAATGRSPLTRRDFRLLWAGTTISQILGMTSPVAFPLIAVDLLSASIAQVGLITALGYLPWLVLTLPAGVYVGRLSPRTVLLAADALRAALVLVVPVLYLLDALALWHLYAVVTAVGVCSVAYEIAFQTMPTLLLPREALMGGNARLQAGRAVSFTLGPALGGALVTLLGAPLTPVANAVGFVVSGCCVAALRARGRVSDDRPGGGLRRQLGEGLRFVVSQPLLRTSTLASAIGNCCFAGYEALVVVFLAKDVGLPAGQLGVLVGTAGLGSLLGAAVASRVARRLGTARAVWVPALAVVPFGLMLPATHRGVGVLLFVAGAVVFCAGFGAFTVGQATLVQSAAPPALLSRTIACTRFVTRSMLFVGGLAGGWLGSVFGPRTALAIVMGCWALAPAAMALSSVRRLRDVPVLEAEPGKGERDDAGHDDGTSSQGSRSRTEP
uniref:Ata9 protein n=1 Tax=Saccharothrix mutabilis subsp. capreolus TaxID=66854 RepID=Q83W10_STRMP|nr:Ata9 protein [Saccharothrix mutabilis subsp. capreolus]